MWLLFLYLKEKNMKTKLILLLFVVVAACSCSKTKVNTVTNTTTVTTIDTPFEAPVKSLFAKGGLIDSLAIYSSTNYELGSEFFTSANGTISQLGCICPTKNKAYRVSLWNFTTNQILATVLVTPTDSLHFFYTGITPVNITANVHYVISVNNSVGGVALPFYLFVQKSTPLNPLPFPYSDGDITFVNSYYEFSATTVFPDLNQNSYVAPADFVFKAD